MFRGIQCGGFATAIYRRCLFVSPWSEHPVNPHTLRDSTRYVGWAAQTLDAGLTEVLAFRKSRVLHSITRAQFPPSPTVEMADILTPEQRSYCMSRIRGKDTSIELQLRSALHGRGLRFRKNVMSLPGRPDIVFPRTRVAVFIDGDFWHGFRFSQWADRLSAYWASKIERNRARDVKNFRRLRREGWRVVRVWEHQVKMDLDGCAGRIARIVASRKRSLS